MRALFYGTALLAFLNLNSFHRAHKVCLKQLQIPQAFSIAGGGDTLAAIDKYDIANKVSYISTGGGAFLEFVEGKKLPAVEALEQAALKKQSSNKIS